MSQAAENRDIAESFRNSAQRSIPEFVFVYEHTGEEAEIRFENVTIRTPLDKIKLIENLNFTLKAGERAGLTGPNGAGKSSGFRTMAELTSAGKGKIHITLPQGKRLFIASQEMRKPPTTLPGIMSYGSDVEYEHGEYAAALEEAGLPQLKAHLPWNTVDADILFPRFKEALDNELFKYTPGISAKTSKAVLEALVKRLGKKIDVPETLEEYFTPEHEEALRQKLIEYSTRKLSDPETEQGNKSILFPGHTGRKIARNALQNGNNNIQNWLLQGHNMSLSGGQVEKLGFARMFLQIDEVGIFLLDEVTSALKEDAADELYAKLFEKAKNVTAIGIIHSSYLLKHFTHHLELDDNKHVTYRKLENTEPQDSTTVGSAELDV